MLGEVLEAVFSYLERAAGAVHSRLVSTCHTVLANKLCLSACSVVVVWAVVLILALYSVVSANPMEIPYSWLFHIRLCI